MCAHMSQCVQKTPSAGVPRGSATANGGTTQGNTYKLDLSYYVKISA